MRKILLYLIIIALAICTYLSISYAYYSISIGTNQNISTNVAIDACITLTVSSQVNLTGDKAVPITDNRALTNTDYRTAFTVYNKCSTAQNVDIAFAPGSANTMPIEAIKYALYEQGATVPTAGTALSTNEIKLCDRVISETLSSISETVEYGYLIGNNLSIPANSSKAYYVNTWIDYSEGGGGNLYTANKTAILHLLAARDGELGGPLLTEWLVNTAPKSGIAANSNPWILTSDRTGEWRYAGDSPENYIQFNGEKWQIIGLISNTEYCTGTYGTSTECDTTSTGSLVKIMRGESLGQFAFDLKGTNVGSSKRNYGSNDWSDSQLMLMLNGANYLTTAYDENGTQLHTNYTITNNVVKAKYSYSFYNVRYSYLDGNGVTVYKPSNATTSSYTASSTSLPKKIWAEALAKIATVKWHLYGVTNSYSTDAGGSPTAYYNLERNIDNTGAVYTDSSLYENRPVYWFGKIGLMYPSDYGYATNGDGSENGSYSRTYCLGRSLNSWAFDNDKIYCAGRNWIANKRRTIWSITPSGNSYYGLCLIGEAGGVSPQGGGASIYVYPTLYLNTDVIITGGSGTYNNPYKIE